MPAAASLTNNTSTAAFTVPAGALGFVLWNKSATELRLRVGLTAAADGEREGIPIPPGDETPKYLSHYFEKPLAHATEVHLFQASGDDITSGVGYEIIIR